MHDHVAQACVALQKRLARTQKFNPWLNDQAEEALNELVSNPHRITPPDHQVRNAQSNASKKLGRRAGLDEEFLPTLSFGSDRAITDSISTVELVLDIVSVLDCLSAADQALLLLAADGADADEIALEMGIPVQRARERLSRARTRARALWLGTLS